MSFNRAVLRKSGEEIVNAISQHSSDEKPDFKKAREQHILYADTLK